MNFDDYELDTASDKKPNKRGFDDISKDLNQNARELEHQKKKLKEKGLDDDKKEEQKKTTIILNKPDKKEDLIPSSTKLKEIPILSCDKVLPANRPILWINRLRYYPTEELLPNMLSFREILFEDLLKSSFIIK